MNIQYMKVYLSALIVSSSVQRMADKTVDGGQWTGCAVMFLQSLCPGVNLLSLYKDPQGKFIIFKVIKLTLTGEPSVRHFSYCMLIKIEKTSCRIYLD